MDGMTCTNTLSQCRVRHYQECGQTRENVTCEGDLSSTLSSHTSFVSPIFYVDRFGAKHPCALPRNEESGPLVNNAPLTGYEPNSSTTTTSQRPLKFSSRSPPATPGPRTFMTRRSVTAPSAERSLHHCSLRSEKNQRAVDKLITLLKKVCCQVSRCLSVM